MSRKRKALNAVTNGEAQIEDYSPEIQRYIHKKLKRSMNEVQTYGQGLPDRLFPCQKIKGQYARISASAQPEIGDDGKWYIKDKLIVSDTYINKQFSKAMIAAKKKSKEANKNVASMLPEKLGTDD